MTDTNTTSTQSKGKAPSHGVYHVRDSGNGGKGFWTRIGAAWPHSDGKGFNAQVDCVPLDGRITLRIIDDKRD